MTNINIAIVDDQNLFRQSLGMLINSVEHFNLIGDYSGGELFIKALNDHTMKVDIAIVDMDMPGMNGDEVNNYLHRHHPQIKVIILSVHVNAVLISRMINAGAASYLAKNCDKDELMLAIEMVYKMGFYFNAEVINAIRAGSNNRSASQTAPKDLPVSLNTREQQILQMVCKEYSNAEIAAELFLSVRTVEGYRTGLINKINCRNTAGLVLFAIKHRLFEIQ